MVVAVLKSALKRGDVKRKPKRSVVFGERSRTIAVQSSDYAAKKPEDGYVMKNTREPRQYPEFTEEEKAQALQDAQEMAKKSEEDDDARGCLWLLHYKFRYNADYLHTYYNQTCQEASREEQKGDWRPSPCASEVDDQSDAEMPDEK
tara:strand:+ start:115 stop:555 length:441 start_codon:yes stop_codon:yes gene_type:complete